MAQCAHKTAKGRQCKLETHGEDTKHRFTVPHAALKDVIPAGFKLVPTDSKIAFSKARTTSVERGPEQKQVDKWASAAYEAWVRAGKPDFAKKELRTRYMKDLVVPPKAVGTVLSFFRNATSNAGPLPGKTFRYTRGMHESGNTIIQYTYMDAKPKDNSED